MTTECNPVGGEFLIVTQKRQLRQSCSGVQTPLPCAAMKDLLVLLAHLLLITIAKLLGPGGTSGLLGKFGYSQSPATWQRQGAFRREWQALFKKCNAVLAR